MTLYTNVWSVWLWFGGCNVSTSPFLDNVSLGRCVPDRWVLEHWDTLNLCYWVRLACRGAQSGIAKSTSMRFRVRTHRPGTRRPRDVTSMGHIIQGMQCPRISVSGHIGRGPSVTCCVQNLYISFTVKYIHNFSKYTFFYRCCPSPPRRYRSQPRFTSRFCP
jgi:hypothetical protein